MGYIEKHLIPGEQVHFKTRLHSITVFFPVLIGALIVFAGAFSLYRAEAEKSDPSGQYRMWAIAGGLQLVAGAVIVLYAVLKRNATEMAVTNKRILIKTGFASRRTLELLLSRVESIVITEPFFGRMLGYGTVVIRGTGGTPEPFDQIAKPMEFRRAVQEQIESGQIQPKAQAGPAV